MDWRRLMPCPPMPSVTPSALKSLAAALALGGLALFVPVAAPDTAAAQSCRVTASENGSWDSYASVGQVVTFGDLKLRVLQTGRDTAGERLEWMVVDVKAPGLLVNGYRLNGYKPVKFTACGQEVTLTYLSYNSMLRVSVF